ncbi:MAG: hypothetical protein QOG11_358 [Solirubrobacteraceae bacterium]|nr:hypothetical protein [Solirubrobacteraceae bacterium]
MTQITTTPGASRRPQRPADLVHRSCGWAHAQLHHAHRRLVEPASGQGTVEYVALLLLVAGILTAVVAAGAGKHFNIAQTVGNKLNEVIGGVGKGSGK